MKLTDDGKKQYGIEYTSVVRPRMQKNPLPTLYFRASSAALIAAGSQISQDPNKARAASSCQNLKAGNRFTYHHKKSSRLRITSVCRACRTLGLARPLEKQKWD